VGKKARGRVRLIRDHVRESQRFKVRDAFLELARRAEVHDVIKDACFCHLEPRWWLDGNADVDLLRRIRYTTRKP